MPIQSFRLEETKFDREASQSQVTRTCKPGLMYVRVGLGSLPLNLDGLSNVEAHGISDFALSRRS